METHNLDSWEAFEDEVKQIEIKTEELEKSTSSHTTSVFYRGQANAEWHLKSTLERKVKKDITVDSYFNLMLKIWNSPVSTFKKKWPDFENEVRGLNVNDIHLFLTARANSEQIIHFMAHLRHYGFPSPLLDWTEDSRIAAFFAFGDIPDNAERIAIYTFREDTGYMSDMSNMLEPTAMEIGHNIPGIERHENQESHYTLCVQQDNIGNFKNAKFANMEKDINKSGFYLNDNGNDIDLDLVENVTNKYTIPVSERNKVLKKLQTKGINRCFLFQEETEDSQLFDYWNIILANEQI